jgi:hypothetical protein
MPLLAQTSPYSQERVYPTDSREVRIPVLTILDENLGTWLLSGSGATAEHEEDANTWVKQRGKKTSDY